MVSLLDLLGQLADWSYLIIFLAALCETIPGLGVVIPGQLIVHAGGAAAALGYIDLPEVVVAAALGAILGDYLGYLAGRAGGHALALRLGARLGLREEHLERARAALTRGPFIAIVIGRFNNLTRAFIPYVAGSLGYPRGKFFAYNVLGGLLWSVFAAVVGFLFGRSLKAAEALMGRAFAVLFLLALVVFVSYKLLRLAAPRASAQAAAWFVVGVASFAGFLLVAEDVAEQDGLLAWDEPAAQFVDQYARMAPFLPTISDLGTAVVVLPLILITAGALWWSGHRRTSLQILILFGVTQALVAGLKYAFHRPRPGGAASLAFDFSFPSGHTTTAALLAALLAWFVYKHVRKPVLPTLALFGALAWVILMAASRLVLQVHFLSDVLGGALLGLAIAGLGLAGPLVLPDVATRGLDLIERAQARRRA